MKSSFYFDSNAVKCYIHDSHNGLYPFVKKVIVDYKNKSVIVYFKDDTKEVSTCDCRDSDNFNPEFGVALCLLKKVGVSYTEFIKINDKAVSIGIPKYDKKENNKRASKLMANDLTEHLKKKSHVFGVGEFAVVTNVKESDKKSETMLGFKVGDIVTVRASKFANDYCDLIFGKHDYEISSIADTAEHFVVGFCDGDDLRSLYPSEYEDVLGEVWRNGYYDNKKED